MNSISAVNQGEEAHLSISDTELNTIVESCETLVIKQKISVQNIISLFSKITGYNLFCKQIVTYCNQILLDTETTSNAIITVCNSIKPKDIYVVVDHDEATGCSTSTAQSSPLSIEMITKAIEVSQIFKNSLQPSNLQLPIATQLKLTMATSKTELHVPITTSKPEMPMVTSKTSLPKATIEPKIATSNCELPIATSQQKLSVATSQEKVSFATSGSKKRAKKTSTKTITGEAIPNIGLPQSYTTANIPDFNLLQCNLKPRRTRPNKELSELRTAATDSLHSSPPVSTSLSVSLLSSDAVCESVPLLSSDAVCKAVPATSGDKICTNVKNQILKKLGRLPIATSSVCSTGDTSGVSLTSSDPMCKSVPLLSSGTVCKGVTLPSSDTVCKGVPFTSSDTVSKECVPLLSSDTECTILTKSSVPVPINNSVQLTSNHAAYVSLTSSDIICKKDVSLTPSDTACNDATPKSDDIMCQNAGTLSQSQSSVIEVRIENDLDLNALGGEGDIILVLQEGETLEFNDVTNLYNGNGSQRSGDNMVSTRRVTGETYSRIINEIIPYQCDLCPKKFEYESFFLRHKKTHVRYKCDRCPKTFRAKAFLLRHNKSHENKAARLAMKQNQNFICDTCGKVFKKRDRLRDHKLIHLDHKPLACPYCDYRCVKQNYMKSHLIKHVGKRTHQCAECGKCFSRIETLRSHSFLHENPPRQFTCDMCPKRFSQRSAMYYHKREFHRKPQKFPCMVCGRVFKRKEAVNSHMRRHTGEKPYTCKTCGKKYRHASAYYSHIKTCDGKEEEEEESSSVDPEEED